MELPYFWEVKVQIWSVLSDDMSEESSYLGKIGQDSQTKKNMMFNPFNTSGGHQQLRL